MIAAATLALALAGEPALVWPLEFDDGLSSSFGELRGDRLHTGIDLKTRGAVGAEVYAADDGAVIRLKEQWRGYGLAVYVQHPNGLVTVYGHLDRLRDDLQAIVAERRRRGGRRWAGDITVAPPRPVRRGETIAWSGESGAGMPHLHFEVRRGMATPIDPFTAGLAAPADPSPPVAERLLIEPASGATTIDGKPDAVALPLRRDGDAWVTDRRPRIAGPVHLRLTAYDTVGATNRAGLGRLRTRIDGEVIYELRFDSIPFGRNQTSGVILDLGRSHMSPTWFSYRLTGLAGGRVPFASGASEPFELPPGRHRVEIDLGDAVTRLGYRTTVRLELESGAVEAAPAAAGPRRREAAVRRLRVEPRGDDLHVAAVLEGIDGDRLEARLGDAALELVRSDGATFTGWSGAPPLGETSLTVGDREARLGLARITPAAASRLALGRSRLTIGAGAAWADALLVGQTSEVSLPDGLELVAPAIALAPDGHPFRRPIEVAFERDGSDRRDGVYRLDRVDGSWSFLDVGPRAEVRRLGLYALLRDRAAPTIVEVTPPGGGRVAPGPVAITIRVADVGSGIPERGVEVRVDGERLDERYDPDRGVVRATAELSPGTHRITVIASDWAGNRSSWSGAWTAAP